MQINPTMAGMVSAFSGAQQNTINADTRSAIESILSDYDSGNLTEDDAKNIVSAISELGVTPSLELRNIIADAGFDAREIGDLAGVGRKGGEGGMQGPPPTNAEMVLQSMDADSLQMLKEILEQYDLTNISSNEEEQLLQQLANSGLLNPGAIVNEEG